MKLDQQRCTPCTEGTPALTESDARALLQQVPGWTLSPDGKWLMRRFKFPDFIQALAVVNRIGDLAEAEQHHPDLKLGWGYVEAHLQTHAAHGLHKNDFILAAKINALNA